MNTNKKWMECVRQHRAQLIHPDSKCLLCGSKDFLTLDHLIPVSVLRQFGISKYDSFKYEKNFAIMCKPCNSMKERYVLMELPETKEAIKQLFNL